MDRPICMEHSGMCAKIEQCEKNDIKLFDKIDELQVVIYKAVGGASVITAILAVALQKVFK